MLLANWTIYVETNNQISPYLYSKVLRHKKYTLVYFIRKKAQKYNFENSCETNPFYIINLVVMLYLVVEFDLMHWNLWLIVEELINVVVNGELVMMGS